MNNSTDSQNLRHALRDLLLWLSKISLQEIDEDTLNMLRAEPWRSQLDDDKEAAAWLALPNQEALDQAAEAYAAEFLLPKGVGLRLCQFLPGESEALGLGLERELHAALVTLGKTVSGGSEGEKLPADHPSIALSVVATALEPGKDLDLLLRQRFMLALSRWAQRLMEEGQHPLYRNAGRLGHEALQGVLELLGASDWGSAASPAPD